jgi:hypothetical protein
MKNNVLSVFKREIKPKSIIIIKNKNDKKSIIFIKKTEILSNEKKLSDFLMKLLVKKNYDSFQKLNKFT